MRKITNALILAILALPIYVEAQQLNTSTDFRRDREQLCRTQWTTQGRLDQRNHGFCLTQQEEAYAELQTIHRQYVGQGFYSRYAFSYCRDSWTVDGVSDALNMLYCLNDEVEGYNTVQVYRKLYSANRIEPIVNRSLSESRSWRDAAFQIKNNANLKKISSGPDR